MMTTRQLAEQLAARIARQHRRPARVEDVRQAASYDAGRECGVRGCDREIDLGEEIAQIEYRRHGRSVSDTLRVHAACLAAHAPSASSPSAAPARRGRDCRYCGGPVADGSGDCRECR